jgi:hypothetical protein
MTPDTQQARDGYRRPQVHGRDAATTSRSGALAAEPARTGNWSAVAQPSPASTPTRTAARRARDDTSIVRVIPFLAVILVTIAGVYIAWRQGSAGGGEGGAVGGVALLGAAVARLLLPARLVGLLATRKRATDVITLTVFGVSLLVAGLVLPR